LIWLGSGEQPISLAGWAAPVLLLRVVRDLRAKTGLPQAGLAIAAGTFAGFYGMSPGPIAGFALSVLIGSALELLPYALDKSLFRLRGSLVSTLPLPVAMVALSWLTGLGGGTAGNIAYLADDRLSQLAAIGGLWPLVFLPYWAAACLNFSWEHRHDQRRAMTPLVALATVVLVANVYGAFRLAAFDNASSTVRVAGITTTPEHRQRLLEIAAPLFVGQMLDDATYDNLLQHGEVVANDLMNATLTEADAGAKLIVWSEAAVPVTPQGEGRLIDRASVLATKAGIALGITTAVLDDDWQRKMAAAEPFLTNRLVMVAPTGEVAWTYSKAHLVPGYEQAAFHPGSGELHAVETHFGRIVGNICFDADFPSTTRAAGRKGAAVLVVPSNDWLEIRNLHSRVARMRAVENGVSVLRPTSTGRSVATDPAGRIVAKVDFFDSGGAPLIAQLPLKPTRTVYAVIGDLFAYLCCTATFAFILLGVMRGSRNRAPGDPARA